MEISDSESESLLLTRLLKQPVDLDNEGYMVGFESAELVSVETIMNTNTNRSSTGA